MEKREGKRFFKTRERTQLGFSRPSRDALIPCEEEKMVGIREIGRENILDLYTGCIPPGAEEAGFTKATQHGDMLISAKK